MSLVEKFLKEMKSSSQTRSMIISHEERLTNINTNIEKRTIEAEAVDIDIEKRDLIISQIEKEVEERSQVEETLTALRSVEQTLKSREQSQFGVLGNVTSSAVEGRQARASEVDDLYASVEYRDAWVEYLKTGSAGAIERLVSTKTTGAGNGGVVIPTLVAEKIETTMRTGGRIAVLCRKLFAKGYLSVPYEVSATDAGFHKEGEAALAEEVIELGTTLLSPQYIKKWIQITDELESLDPGAFVDYLIAEIVDKVAKALDDAIISRPDAAGKGVIGILENAKVPSLTLDLDFGTGFSAMAQLDDGVEDHAVAVMNRATYFNTIMQLKDTTGKPIYSIVTDAENKPQYFYAGMPVVFSAKLPEYTDMLTTGTDYMVVGDFGGYTLNFPNGEVVELIRDAISKSEQDLIKYVGKLFVSGDATKLKHLVKVKKA